MFAFGGAGPAHAGVFAKELGVRQVIIPQRETASTWCAFGAASADVMHVHEQVSIMAAPFDAEAVNRILGSLENGAAAEMARDGISDDRLKLHVSVDMRHKGQINEVEVDLDGNRVEAGFQQPLAERFYDRYEKLYGRGSSFRGAQLEIVTFRIRSTAAMPRPRLQRASQLEREIAAQARRANRQVWFEEAGGFQDTEVFAGLDLRPGNAIDGPALVETPDTVVVIRPDQRLEVDAFGNFELKLDASLQ